MSQNHNRAAGRPPEYLAAELHRALTEDPRTAEQGVRVRIRGDVVVLDGEVGTAQRRRLLEDVVHEIAPDAQIHNDVHVAAMPGPGECEDLGD
ncbi:BON domain-containing protein [Nocardia sp. NBC_01329]|uniref:BON domain-containing protein n=1 Tax=Nocardia sp. NBC_01329 TaxID=2903594 RepID=UPI003FA3C865|nr:BON domain-containing protein [Nocardia sp. NBC_01329]